MSGVKGTSMSTNMTRSNFVKGGALAVGLAAGATSMAGSAFADGTVSWDYETDIAIVGSGIGGFSAAFAAHESGASTIMVEISSVTGGGSSFSGGLIHLSGAPSGDDAAYDAFTDGLMTNQPLAHAYVNDFPDFIEWLLDLGLRCTPLDYVNPLGEQWGTIAMLGSDDAIGLRGCRAFFDSCQDLYVQQGGTLLMETVAQHVITDGSDTVIGLQCRDNNTREAINIKANAVVLATGGFQADEELRTRYYGPDASMATIHACPYCTGSGLKMALELGASMQGSLNTFSGTLAPAWPAVNRMCDPATYESLGYPEDGREGKYALYDSHLDFAAEGSIFINLNGDRFTDEGARHYRPQQAIARQKHATALMVMDDTVFQEYWNSATYTLRTIGEQFEECILIPEVGGVLYEADTVEDLADALIEGGVHAVNKAHFVKTIEEYNTAVEAGTTAELPVPRELGNIVALVTPPFYAFPMTTSIYAPFGGLAVNQDSAVLDKNLQPIPGLYATFPTSGGFMRELYTGAMAAAGVTGRWAGRAAAQAAR